MPMVGAMVRQNDNSALIAHEIANFFSENSLSKMQEYYEKLTDIISCYQCALMEVETKFRVLNEQFSVRHERNPIETIKTRIKSPDSIYEKLVRKNLPVNLSSIENGICDIAGIRVICSFVDDIYMLANCLLQQDDITLIERKDYIEKPKSNGYRSLHLIVEVPIFLQNEKRLMKVEVQLRTIAMEFWANLEHKMKYKKNLPDDVIAMTSAELLQCAEMSALLDSRMQAVRDIIEQN